MRRSPLILGERAGKQFILPSGDPRRLGGSESRCGMRSRWRMRRGDRTPKASLQRPRLSADTNRFDGCERGLRKEYRERRRKAPGWHRQSRTVGGRLVSNHGRNPRRSDGARSSPASRVAKGRVRPRHDAGGAPLVLAKPLTSQFADSSKGTLPWSSFRQRMAWTKRSTSGS